MVHNIEGADLVQFFTILQIFSLEVTFIRNQVLSTLVHTILSCLDSFMFKQVDSHQFFFSR